MGNIFKKHIGSFKSANWNALSTLMIERDGVYIEAEAFHKGWPKSNVIDESGLDETGRDWRDIDEEILRLHNNEKRKTKRL